MDRRQALFGAASALAASTTIAQAASEKEKEYCINPWQQKTDNAMVKISDILLVGFISVPPTKEEEDLSWLEVWTQDGRFLTTELACNQDDVYQLHAALTQGMEVRKKEAWYTLYKPVGVELSNLLERWDKQ